MGIGKKVLSQTTGSLYERQEFRAILWIAWVESSGS